MARARPAALQGPLSGVSGGAEFRTRGGSFIISPRARRRRPPSPAQLEHRRLWGELSARWGKLDPADQQAWIAWADLFGDGLDPPVSRAAGGKDRFMQYAVIAHNAGEPPLDAPTNAGVGPAEFAVVDLFANVEAGTLSIKMIQPMLEVDADPTRVVVYLSPARPRRRRADPRTYSPIAWFDPKAGQPGIDVPEIVVPLPNTPIARPWYWGASKTTGGDGNVSLPGVWPLETTPPGETWAFRCRPFADFIELNRVERTAAGFLVFYGSVNGNAFVDPHDLSDPSNATIADLIATINKISPWRTTAENVSTLTRDSVDIPVFPLREKTITSQPTLITVTA